MILAWASPFKCEFSVGHDTTYVIFINFHPHTFTLQDIIVLSGWSKLYCGLDLFIY